MWDEREPWTVRKYVGRVVEVFVRNLPSRFEVARFSQAIYDAAVGTTDAILIVDLRTPVIFSDDVASAVVDLMVRANAVRKKTAILLARDHAVFGLQLGRLAKEASDSKRQLFYEPRTLFAWLDKDVDFKERARIRTFLNLDRVEAHSCATAG